MWIATSAWFTSFAPWPAPGGPQWTIFFPMAARTGRTASSAAASPPTMMVSVPASAPVGPPLTGQSRAWIPLARAAS